MGDELSTFTGHQDWSKEHVKPLLDWFLIPPSPPLGAPSSNLSIDAPENSSHPSNSLNFPGEASPTFFCTLPMPPTHWQHPSVVTPIPGGSAFQVGMQTTTVPVLYSTSPKMPLLDFLSPSWMPLSPSAQTPMLRTDVISSLTSILQDGHPHAPDVARGPTSLGTETLVASRGSLAHHLLYGQTASGTPGFSAGTPMYQPTPNVNQVSLHFVSMPSANVHLTHHALCLCRDTTINASTLQNGVHGHQRARSCATSIQSFRG